MKNKPATISDALSSVATNADPNPPVGQSVADESATTVEVGATENVQDDATGSEGDGNPDGNQEAQAPTRKRRGVGSRRKVKNETTQEQANPNPFVPPTQNATAPSLEPDEVIMSPKDAAELIIDLLDSGFAGYIQLRHTGWLQNDGIIHVLQEQGINARELAEIDDKSKKRLEKALVRYLETNPVKLTPLQHLGATVAMTFGMKIATLEKIRWEIIRKSQQGVQ